MTIIRDEEQGQGPPAFSSALFAAVAFDDWVIDFVRENNRLSGILREPSPAETAAHRGLLAARSLSAANLEMFVRHVQSGATLRVCGAGENRPDLPQCSTMYADLDRMLRAAQECRWPPQLLHRVFMLLCPFTDANGRSGRALWLWQQLQTTTGRPSGPPQPGEVYVPSGMWCTLH